MTQARRPAGTPVGGQFAPIHRPASAGVELNDDEMSPLLDGFEGLVVAGGPLRGDGRIIEVLENPDGDGRDRWSVRFLNGEEVIAFADDFELLVDESGDPVSRSRAEEEIVAARRANTMRRLAEDEAFDTSCSIEDAVDDVHRFLLVERSVISGGASWATFDSLEEAASYHVGQECPEYWDAAYLLDLDTGERFSPVAAMAWQPGQPNDKEQP
ncbi:MAG: hypothetical protein M0010_15110 [Actinomycetota bacterium]|nr:hypothetical protein [Actinomycetota bacterium]